MPFYKYKIIKDGVEHEENKEFPDKVSLYNEVKRDGAMIISVDEVENKYSGKFNFKLRSGIKADEKISFAKNLAVMVDAGISISRALAIMGKQTTNKNFLKTMQLLGDSVSQGKSLSESMRNQPDIFTNLFVMMVKAGEESGKMSESLRIVAGQMERANQLTKKIKGAMIYPIIVIIVMIILGVLLMVYMVPTLTETFKGLNVPLPLPTRIIISISDFMRDNFIFIIGSTIALVIGGIYFFRARIGRRFSDFSVLHIPVIKTITKEVNSARTTRTLSSLTSSGVDIVVAIGVTKDVIQNSYYKEVLEKIEADIQKGATISGILGEAKNLYPVYVSEMTAVGEETGELSKMLQNIAEYYEGEVDQKTKDLSTIIEPVLMILIGIAVGVFAISMLLPTYSLVDVIK